MARARARSLMAPSSALASMARLRWLSEVYATLITEKGMFTDFRVSIGNLETGEIMMTIGGIWHNWAGYYIPKEEVEAQGWPDPPVWWMNKPQVRLFSLLPALMDTSREIPVMQIQARGGRRSGKTEGAIRLAMAIAAALPFSKIGICGMDFKSNQEMLLKIGAIMPEGWYSYYDLAKNTLYLRNGSMVVFFSQKKWRTIGRSYSFDLILLDEPTTYDQPQAVLEGFRGSSLEQDTGAIVSIYTPPPIRDVFYWEEQKSKSADPELYQSIKTLYFGSTMDNTTLSPKAIRKTMLMAKNMSESEYMREIMGRYSRSTGAAFYDYRVEHHVRPAVPDYLVDITAPFCEEKFRFPAEWICGMDFNESPMSFCAYKLYWDPSGGTLVCHHFLTANGTNTEKFIYSHIFPWLRGLYPTLPDADLAMKIALVADASAWWQGTGAKTHGDAVTPARDYLMNAGFQVYQPKPFQRRSNTRKTNTERYGKNPIRQDRMEAFRARLWDRYAHAHILWLESAKPAADCVENLELANGLPDYKSEHAHGYDACSYPVFNLYPRLQLSAVDEDALNWTYRLVHDIGQKHLTPEQRKAHPVAAAIGRDLLT